MEERKKTKFYYPSYTSILLALGYLNSGLTLLHIKRLVTHHDKGVKWIPGRLKLNLI
jgi:hypothetical protein